MAHNYLGVILRDKGQIEEAIARFRKAIELEPEYADAHNKLGLALWKKGLAKEAIASYRKAVELAPKDTNAQTDLATALNATGDMDEAIAICRQVIRLEPNNAVAHGILGQTLAVKGQFSEAVAAYREAIRLRPDMALAWNNLAWLLSNCPDPKARNPAEAVKLAKKAIQLAPEEGDLWNTLGVGHYRAADWKAAREALHKSIELRKGGDAFDWFFLAMANWKLDQKDEAHKWYEKAAQWMENNAPQNEELRRFRAEAEELLGIKKQP
jgi:tetratricopeptide (TPR) repeat protein